MNRRNFLQLGAGGLVVGAASSVQAAEPLVVIVNSNVKETPSGSELAAIFTTRKQSWGGGQRIVPFNFPAKHPTRVAFDRAVLSMNADEIARYWIDRRIRGGNPPPKQVPHGRLIARLVERLNGAVGYVPESMATGNVRIVKEV